MERSTLALATLLLACDVSQEATSLERDVPFACDSDGDCPEGSCLAQFGICTRSDGKLENLLFEVTPQASDPVYGGARFLVVENVASALGEGQRATLNVRPRVPVTGRVLVPPELESCLWLARSTLPVALTFTPREQLLGLSLPSYEIKTSFDASIVEYVFEGSLPPGSYDVYMLPEYESLNRQSLSDDCRAIPQIFRNRSIGLGAGTGESLELNQPQPWSLRLTIPWEERLDGWTLDMVHPVTGEVISNVVELRAGDRDANTNTLVATLNYSTAEFDFIGQAEELVRLAPPRGVAAGTMLFQRSALATAPGEGTITNVASFGTPVAFQAWVWKKGETDSPVPGSVAFSSLELDQVDDGVFASFETTAMVDATGQVNVTLLPGRYRVRVTPPALEMVNLGLMAGYETSVTVWADEDGSLQGGHVIEVPPARFLSGQVLADTDGSPLRRVEIRASATDPRRNLCPEPPDDASPTCERPRAPVLQRALAQDPYIPRTRNGLSESDGTYTVDGLDCGRCEREATTPFDLTARPEISTGLPWVVRAGVDPIAETSDSPVAALRIPLPVARPMRVTYGDPIRTVGPDKKEGTADDPEVTWHLSGALVRVFAVLDGEGRVVADPESLPPCISAESPESANCAESLIQVAEARTDSDGGFLLLLPPDLE
jgi:hypothetical protein